jgi:hypothetical protein
MTATTKEALWNRRYALGAALEVYIALSLLSSYSGGPAVWLGYLLLTTSAAIVLYGVVWYWRWCHEIGYATWYVAALTFLIGCGIIYVSNEPASPFPVYEPVAPDPWRERALIWGMVLATFLPVYAAWRTVRRIVIEAFKVLLIAVAQLGAAWRGELRP